jgi:amino-acid N-acetyltransferase
VRLREAEERDIPAILTLINDYAQRNLLLARTEESLRERLADFAVAEIEGEVAGCAALTELGTGLGEIRSLAVRADMSGRGLGRALIEHLRGQAFSRGFVEVLALTRRVSLFERMGFHVARRERFLDKLAADCKACPLNLCCDETAVHWIPPEALADARAFAAAVDRKATAVNADGPDARLGSGDRDGQETTEGPEKPGLFARLLPPPASHAAGTERTEERQRPSGPGFFAARPETGQTRTTPERKGRQS